MLNNVNHTKAIKMKTLFLTLTFCGLAFVAKSQEATVEKSLFEIQTGYLGIWVHNEIKLSSSTTLRSEIGLQGVTRGSFFPNGVGFLLRPTISLEPRLYYNLEKRQRKSKRIDGNSGDYILMSLNYNPNWFTISGLDNVNLNNGISLIPTWGIRRSIGKQLTVEAGVGVGAWVDFVEQVVFPETNYGIILSVPLRIGYRF